MSINITKLNALVAEGKINDDKQFRKDLVEAISNSFDFNETQAKLVAGYAWREGHSYGYCEAVNIADEIGDIVKSAIDSI